MSDLISKSALLKALERDKISICSYVYSKVNPADVDDLESELEYLINNQPTVDAVEVVRCKDCKHWGCGVAGETDAVKCCEFGKYMVGANGYCVYGERK